MFSVQIRHYKSSSLARKKADYLFNKLKSMCIGPESDIVPKKDAMALTEPAANVKQTAETDSKDKRSPCTEKTGK